MSVLGELTIKVVSANAGFGKYGAMIVIMAIKQAILFMIPPLRKYGLAFSKSMNKPSKNKKPPKRGLFVFCTNYFYVNSSCSPGFRTTGFVLTSSFSTFWENSSGSTLIASNVL